MNFVKIYNGRVEVRIKTGVLLRTIGTGNAVFTDIKPDDSLMNNGKVEPKKSGRCTSTINRGR